MKKVLLKMVSAKIHSGFNVFQSKQPIKPQQPQQQKYVKDNVIKQQQQHKNFESSTTKADIDVSETIVLPSKNTSDRLDFTQKWLANDIKSWAEHSSLKPDLLMGSTAENSELMASESDEHSLGSCSAEVAAINAYEKRNKKRETPDLIKIS